MPSYLTLVIRIPIWYTTEVPPKMARHAAAFLILEEEWFLWQKREISGAADLAL